MGFSLRLRRGPSNFQRAADGSMTLIEHIRELRNRLFWAALAVLVGLVIGYFLSQPVFDILKQPYCTIYPDDALRGRASSCSSARPTASCSS